MLYNQNNLNVSKVASKSENRPEIAGVFFTKDKTVATDSFKLIEMSVPSDVKVEDFPVMDGKSAMRGVQPFIVPAREVGKIKIPVNKNLPILNNIAIKHVDDKRVEFLQSDLGMASIISMHKVDGQYPDYAGIFPAGEPVAEFQVNAGYLSELLDIMGKLDKNKIVKIKVYGGIKPIVFEAGNETQKARGMLMPIREN
jgi:DNA polymerase III sliding clamp (beta) subunit (PCNA family)